MLQADTEQEEWWSLLAAARLLNVTPSTFRRMLRDGELEGVETYQPATRRLYSRADIERYKASRRAAITKSEEADKEGRE